MRDARRFAADRENGLNVGIEEASTQDALAYHACGAEENDFHLDNQELR
jgi:hypothetical protein